MFIDWLVAPARRPLHALMPLTGAAQSPRQTVSLQRWQQALQAAGLGRLQHSTGSLTVLAPSDAAFDELLAELGLSWTAFVADLPALRTLLLGHVLAQRLDDGPWPEGLLPAIGPGLIRVERAVSGLLLRDAEGRSARLLARGLQAEGEAPLHVIDRVLRPPRLSLLEQLALRPELSDFASALASCGLDSLLRSTGPLTVLAPRNDGFAHLAARLGLRHRELLSRPELLTDLLRQHLIAGRWLSSELPWGDALNTARGSPLRLGPLGLIGTGEAAQPLLPGSDLIASNGVIHLIDQVLLPCC